VGVGSRPGAIDASRLRKSRVEPDDLRTALVDELDALEAIHADVQRAHLLAKVKQ
jgi:hypothetical protein